MKKNNKKQIKKVAPKKVAAKKVSAPKKVTPKKEVAKPAVKKPVKKAAPVKKVAVKKPAVKIVKTKETSKNKKTMKTKWVKQGPKKLAPVKVVKVDDNPAKLLDLSKPVPAVQFPPETVDPVSGAPKPWGSIMPPCMRPTAVTPQPMVRRATAIWVGADPTVSGVSAPSSAPMSVSFRSAIGSVDPSANWTPVMPR